jgi:hypothetical protein
MARGLRFGPISQAVHVDMQGHFTSESPWQRRGSIGFYPTFVGSFRGILSPRIV